MRSSTSLSIVVGVFVLCVSPVYAQYTTASFGGNVVDSNNAVLPQSQVIVRNVDTGFTQTRHHRSERRIPVPPAAGRQLRAARGAAWLFHIRADRHHAHR